MTTPSKVLNSESFHRHLDVCDQCRDYPMSLCRVGALLLVGEVHPATAPPTPYQTLLDEACRAGAEHLGEVNEPLYSQLFAAKIEDSYAEDATPVAEPGDTEMVRDLMARVAATFRARGALNALGPFENTLLASRDLIMARGEISVAVDASVDTYLYPLIQGDFERALEEFNTPHPGDAIDRAYEGYKHDPDRTESAA